MYNNLITNFCIACKHKNSKHICFRMTKPNTLFCGYHKSACTDHIKKVVATLARFWRRVKLNRRYKMLDTYHSHYLLGCESTWRNVATQYICKIQGVDVEWWDIRILAHHFTQQLNQVCMETPVPQYPSNPFTRSPYSAKALACFFEHASFIRLKLNVALCHFGKGPVVKWYRARPGSRSAKIRNHLKNALRFQLTIDDALTISGHWVKCSRSLSTFEKLYATWQQTPIHRWVSGDHVRNNEDGKQTKLDDLATECSNWSIINDDTREIYYISS